MGSNVRDLMREGLAAGWNHIDATRLSANLALRQMSSLSAVALVVALLPNCWRQKDSRS